MALEVSIFQTLKNDYTYKNGQTRLMDITRKIRQDCDETIKNFYHLGITACSEIKMFKPDLVLVLAHGGWGFLWAAQALWEHFYQTPFPPVLIVNIGREKMDRYNIARESLSCAHTFPYTPDYAGLEENGYFLAWSSQQTDWQHELRQKILSTLSGKFPEKILILDDAYFTGFTSRFVLGLLSDILPTCETNMLEGDMFEWRTEIARFWMVEQGLDLKTVNNVSDALDLFHLVPGTENADSEDSLEWTEISSENKVFERLQQILPIETWKQLPVWAKNTIQQGVINSRDIGKFSSDFTSTNICRPSLNPEEVMLKNVCLQETLKL